MELTELHISREHLHKLLSAANGDAALLYLYIHSGNAQDGAERALQLGSGRISCAAATLRQLGLWPEPKQTVINMGERPRYTEQDVLCAMEGDGSFHALYGEVQRLLGRSLNTEELKILLGFVRYLGLPTDVISVLICYCKDRARRRGSSRNPSLRTIEKEAYAWAEQGIDSMEEAAAYIQAQNLRASRLHQLMDTLQIRGRNLTPGEEKYAQQWISWGFEKDAIALAYDKTCLNTGGLSWAYMNKILARWHDAGWHNARQVQEGDKKPAPKGATGQLGEAELEAIAKLLREG